MSTTLNVLNAKKVVSTHKITKGEVLIITAQDKVNYQLVNDATGFGPENIITKREGNDLKIFLEDGDMNADIIIQNHYDEAGKASSNLIVGQMENGKIYAYIPETGLEKDAVSLLADSAIAPQALGGEELAAGLFWSFNPWWLLALAPLAGLAAAAGGKGGSSSSSNEVAQETAQETAQEVAKKAVESAKEASNALEAKTAEALQNGVISSEEKAELENLAKTAEALKVKAEEAVNNLPNSTKEKADLVAQTKEIDNTGLDKAFAESAVKEAENTQKTAVRLPKLFAVVKDDIQGPAVNVYVNGHYQASLLSNAISPIAACAGRNLFSSSFTTAKSFGNRTSGPSFDLVEKETNYIKVAQDANGQLTFVKMDAQTAQNAIAKLPVENQTFSRVTGKTKCNSVSVLANETLSANALFAFNKSGYNDILPAGRKSIAEFAQRLSALGVVSKVVISGHTDPSGSEQYNQVLSQKRAETVKVALQKAGVNVMVEAVGYGEAQPVVTHCNNLTGKRKQQCNQPNRRVEITVYGTK